MIARLINSLYYGYCKIKAKQYIFFLKYFALPLNLFVLLFISKSKKFRVLMRMIRRDKSMIEALEDVRFIGSRFDTSFYVCLMIWSLLVGFWTYLLIEWITENDTISMICALATVLVWFIMYNKYVQDEDRYLSYFKEFEKKDAAWRKKWEIIAFLFPILITLAIFLGSYYVLRLFEKFR